MIKKISFWFPIISSHLRVHFLTWKFLQLIWLSSLHFLRYVHSQTLVNFFFTKNSKTRPSPIIKSLKFWDSYILGMSLISEKNTDKLNVASIHMLIWLVFPEIWPFETFYNFCYWDGNYSNPKGKIIFCAEWRRARREWWKKSYLIRSLLILIIFLFFKNFSLLYSHPDGKKKVLPIFSKFSISKLHGIQGH